MNIAEENKRLAMTKKEQTQTAEVQERIRQDANIKAMKYQIQSSWVR